MKIFKLTGKVKSKVRPVATISQIEMDAAHSGRTCWGVPSPNPALHAPRDLRLRRLCLHSSKEELPKRQGGTWENILAEGKLLAPILVWHGTIVDGHNRYEILQSHPEIPCSVRNLELETREEVLVWICKHQLGRRNRKSF